MLGRYGISFSSHSPDALECPGRSQRRFKIAQRNPHGRQANASLPKTDAMR
jgi:hypothetical protein